MTGTQKEIAVRLFCGWYLMKALNHNGKPVFKIYDGDDRLTGYVYERSLGKKLTSCLKRSRQTHRYSLNLTTVRQQHGKSFLRAKYKEFKKAAAANTKIKQQ